MNSNIKKLLIVLAIVLWWSPVNELHAQKFVSPEEARVAAWRFYQQNASHATPVELKSVDISYVLTRDADTIMYEVNVANSKTVLVSGIMYSKPILAILDNYSPESVLESYAEDGTGEVCFIERYISSIKHCIDSIDYVGVPSPDWKAILTKGNVPKTSSDTTEYLLKTKWGQSFSNDGCDSFAYNHFVGGTWYHRDPCKVGCVAVAMGQIMYFWKYPVFRNGYVHQYNWCKMKHRLRITDDPDYQSTKLEIARLLYECAIAAHMQFCIPTADGASFAYIDDALSALVDEFGFDGSADLIEKDDIDFWRERLKEEIENKRPVLYKAYRGWMAINQQHAFVCDGYNDGTGEFHFNFGWNGSWNGWYDIDPIYIGDSYYFGDKAIVNLYPTGDQDYCDHTLDLTEYYTGTLTDMDVQSRPYEYVPEGYATLLSAELEDGATCVWNLIPEGESSNYLARKSIVLRPGFHANHGSEFHAKIYKCALCEGQSAATTNLPDGDSPSVEGDEVMMALADSSVWQPLPAAEAPDVAIYPNPTSGQLTIDYTQASGNWTRCELYDLQGRHLRTLLNLEQPAGSYSHTLSLAGLPSGPYLLLLRDQSRTSTHRIILQ